MRKTQTELQKRWADKKMQDPMWQEIARRYQEGETAKRLAFVYGQSLEKVRGLVSRLDLRPNCDTPELREMVRLYEGGCALTEIGKLFGCSKQNVSRRIRSHTRMRPCGPIGRPGWPDMIARGEW